MPPPTDARAKAYLELRAGRGALGTGRHFVRSGRESGGELTGTIWLTLLHLPVVPLRRVRARSEAGTSAGSPQRFEILAAEAPSGAESLRTVAAGLAAWALAWSPLAFALFWLKRGSLLAPLLFGLGEAAWIRALAAAVESFEGAVRLLVGAWVVLLAAAVADRRRPRASISGAREGDG
jgi:hypothetical protein